MSNDTENVAVVHTYLELVDLTTHSSDRSHSIDDLNSATARNQKL